MDIYVCPMFYQPLQYNIDSKIYNSVLNSYFLFTHWQVYTQNLFQAF